MLHRHEGGQEPTRLVLPTQDDFTAQVAGCDRLGDGGCFRERSFDSAAQSECQKHRRNANSRGGQSGGNPESRPAAGRHPALGDHDQDRGGDGRGDGQNGGGQRQPDAQRHSEAPRASFSPWKTSSLSGTRPAVVVSRL